MNAKVQNSDGAPASLPQSNSTGWFPVENLTAEYPLAALAYWSQKRGERELPEASDINPAEIPRLLPYLSVVDVLDETPVDYFYRLEGEALRAVYGYRRARTRLSDYREMLGRGYDLIVENYDAVRLSKKPLAGAGTLNALGRSFYAIEWVCLPLSRGGETVQRLVSCVGLVSGPKLD